uniref:Putative phage integrase n=1 Tax=Neisseria musculi TaxID=1815583 RepID=A0A7H1MBX5_9NEIS|nr:putative phage integrase [Neisseria musculi]
MVQQYAHLAPEHLYEHAALLDGVGLNHGTNLAHHKIGGSKEKSLNTCLGLENLVGREGFEPSTNGLKVRCSTS